MNRWKAAAARGIDVVVIDHHQVGIDLPPCHALVNPNVRTTFQGRAISAPPACLPRLVEVLRQRRDGRRRQGAGIRPARPARTSWRLPTVCDVVPLKGLNRAYVVKGLIAARYMKNPGLAAIFRQAGIGAGHALSISASFVGPRINAGGAHRRCRARQPAAHARRSQQSSRDRRLAEDSTASGKQWKKRCSPKRRPRRWWNMAMARPPA